MSQMELQKDSSAAILERVVVGGDLSALSSGERVLYYRAVCESVGLNPLTKPFEYIHLNGKLTLYARRDATDQLRALHGVSIEKLERELVDGIYTVTAYARNADQRTDTAIGAVPIDRLSGEAKANAMMKAETKAKRRVTLSLCGLGLLDETEVGSIPDARPVRVDETTGEVLDTPQPIMATEFASFTAPDERNALMTKIRATADVLGLDAKSRGMLWKKHVGDVQPEEADVAQLADLYDHLGRMRKEKK